MARTIRWKYFFLKDEKEKTDEYEYGYSPTFDTGVRSVLEPPPMSTHMETGLVKGEVALEQQLAAIPTSALARDHGLVQVQPVKELLIERNYLVLPTDKNLGCAVVTRDWYINQCNKILGDKSSYLTFEPSTGNFIAFKKLMKKRRLIVDLAENWTWPGITKQQRSFLVHCISGENPWEGLPRFYGIPKIHKNPWKLRPIIPCHSAMQNPVAKLLSVLLKPIIAKRPYVLEGSKALAMALDKVVLPFGKKVWIVSGDVTAFYPNIPVEKARLVCATYYMEHYFPELFDENGFSWDPSNEEHADKLETFNMMYRIANDDLVFKFQDLLLCQIQGLAMGVACSPDIANLYGASFEEQYVPNNSNVLFYKRYIDDILCIITADDFESATNVVKDMKFDGCEIVWSFSENSSAFLDMMIHLRPHSDRIHYKVYKKMQNHHERIPWASHHPLDVKRGTFIGEITRMATLSSDKVYYDASIENLRELYLARGYPLNVLSAWINKYSRSRWDNRLHIKEEEVQESLLVLKTHFNTVWDYVNIHAVHDAVKQEWDKEFISLESTLRQLTLADVGVLPVSNKPPRRRRRVRKSILLGATLASVGEVISESSDDDLESSELDPRPSAPKKRRVAAEQKESMRLGHDANARTRLATLTSQRMIVSRKRFVTLGDLSSTWRKAVLAYDEDKSYLAPNLIEQLWHQ
jgi:hypothetical protein